MLRIYGCLVVAISFFTVTNSLECGKLLAKSITDTTIYKPICDGNQDFRAVQCKGNWCFCVTKAGDVIKDYGIHEKMAKGMDCLCARKEIEVSRNMNCMYNGNYQTTCLQDLVFDFFEDINEPQCSRSGRFKKVQRSAKKCTCCDREYGQPLTAKKLYQVGDDRACKDVDCQCAHDEFKSLQAGASKKFECAKNGNYDTACYKRQVKFNWTRCDGFGFESVQCTREGKCHCADQTTGLQLGQYRFTRPVGYNMESRSNCLCARHEANYLRYGMKMTARCLPNGNYETCEAKTARSSIPYAASTKPACQCPTYFGPVQCDTVRCWCVNRYGNVLEPYRQPVDLKSSMKCDCAREEDEGMLDSTWHDLLHCDLFGGYILPVKTIRERLTLLEYQD